MKKKFSFIAACIILIFSSCDKKEDSVVTGQTAITTSGTISGQISNYTENATALDSVLAIEENTTAILGNTKIENDGKFSITLTTQPELKEIGAIAGISVSDSTALVGSTTLTAYNNNRISGIFYRSNFTTITELLAGMKYSEFIYSDRPVTLKGTISNSKSVNGIKYIDSKVFDITLKKGWNELIDQYDVASTSTSNTSKITFSSTIPTDIKWVYISSDDISAVKELEKVHASFKSLSFLK